MLMSRALSRVSRSAGARSLLLSAPKHLQTPSNSLVCESPNKLIANNVSLLDYSNLHFDAFRLFGISSSASPQPSEKEHGSAVDSKMLGRMRILERPKLRKNQIPRVMVTYLWLIW